ncbi:porin family protein [Steroidobacter flavus]|uniref:Porin family protein n=1 Tax=Steroidobacter flavus TaxID=1842136 RepID=A0ABV8SXH0_9GAMM
MRKVVVLSVLSIAGIGLSFGTHAEEQPGFYVAASVGEATNESGEFKGSDTAFKVGGGYTFNRYFGIEVAYVDAGTQDDTIGPIALENDSSGVIANAVLRLPLGETFALFGKLGYAFYDSETTSRLGNLSERERDSDEDFAYGAGVELAVWGGLRLRAEYEAVDVSAGDFQIVSAGVTYKF